MDEQLSSHQLDQGYSGGVRSTNMSGNKHDEQPSRPQYSMPGILHFLQTEWARFEMDRAQWEIDRAELQVFLLEFSSFRKFRIYNV